MKASAYIDELRAEIKGLQSELAKAHSERGRNAIIEECARVAELWDFQSKDPVTGDSIADVIRALKK